MHPLNPAITILVKLSDKVRIQLDLILSPRFGHDTFLLDNVTDCAPIYT